MAIIVGIFVSDLVTGISTATYKRYSSKASATAAFAEALNNGQVSDLLPGHSYVVGEV